MKKILISVLSILLIIGVGYSAGIGYYAEKFQANTTFGQVDISNLTLQEAQNQVETIIKEQEINLTENGNPIGTIKLGDLEPELATEEVLTQTYNNQNPNEWLTGYFQSHEYDNVLIDSVDFSPSKISEQLFDLGLDNSERTPARDASIEYSDAQGYYVNEAEAGNQLDMDKVEALIIGGIQSGQDTIEINEAYLEPSVEDNDEIISNVMDEIDKASNSEITLTIADNEVVIPKEEIQSWIYFDVNNEIVFDQNLIHEYLGTLNEEYATYNQPRQFESTYEGTVTVEPGTLGWSIDRETETANIAEDLYAGGSITREPAIVGTGYNTSGSDDIGDSYIEISIDHQHMWVYLDGQVAVETPIVTGQIGTDTVAGAYSIWDKEENANLTGYNPRTEAEYNQPVSYWLPFDDTGQGIHDASWQGSFGGNTYQVSGSLGCINTPPGAMVEVFNQAYLGMPVIIH